MFPFLFLLQDIGSIPHILQYILVACFIAT